MSITSTTLLTNNEEELIQKINEENRLLLTYRLSNSVEKTSSPDDDKSEQIGVTNNNYNNTVIAQKKAVDTTTTTTSSLHQQQAKQHFMNINDKNQLMRTYSFDRIKQFPTYFCRQSSIEIAYWLASSRIRLYSHLTHFSKQFHGLLLFISVYTIVTLLTIQLITGMITILTIRPPSGFIFLVGCILLIACLASKIMINIPQTSTTTIKSINTTTTMNRKSRSRVPTRILLPINQRLTVENKKLA